MEVVKQGLLMFLVLMVLTGVVYPLGITALSQWWFPYQANGSLLCDKSGRVLGSELIGQEFKDKKYFFSRPSATSPVAYNATASSGSNLGPTNKEFLTTVAERVKSWQKDNGEAKVPQDLVTASASGLDPHISVAGAEYQAPRVASARGASLAQVRELISKYTIERQYGFLGERVVNVVKLNLALDENLR